MTNNSPFDEYIKKQFGNYEPQVPAHIWENIIEGKEKKKPAGFWWSIFNNRNMLILLLLVVAGGSVVLINSIYDSPADPAVISKAGKTPGTESQKPSIKTLPTVNSNPDESRPGKEPVAGNIKTGEGFAIGSTNSTKQQFQLSREKNPKAGKTTDPVLKTNYTHGLSDVNVSGRDISKANKNLSHNQSTLTSNKNILQKTPKKENLQDAAGSESSDKFYSNQPIDQEKNADISDGDQYLRKYFLNINTSPGKISNAVVTGIKNPRLNIPCPRSEKNAAGNKRYFEIYGGPDYAFRSLEDTGNSAYLEKRMSTTRFSFAFSVGMRYTKVFHNGMSFRTGINYSQINEKFEFVQGNIVHQVYTIDANGDTTGSYATIATRYKKTLNKYRTLDIPVSIGYELGNGRIHANLNAGIIINVYSWQKGDLLDLAGQPVNITTGKTASPYQFKTNIGIGFIGAASFYYKLNDKLHILAEPHFRYNFSPASKAELSLKQKYNTAGLRVGMRLDF